MKATRGCYRSIWGENYVGRFTVMAPLEDHRLRGFFFFFSPTRVQREQLAAIFQLLKDNTETFGEVSEGDMEEQLRLYSI